MQKENLSFRLSRKKVVLTLLGGRFLHGDKYGACRFMPVEVMWLFSIILFKKAMQDVFSINEGNAHEQ
jgi:hypothetical protein